MKLFIFSFFAVAALSLSSCGKKSEQANGQQTRAFESFDVINLEFLQGKSLTEQIANASWAIESQARLSGSDQQEIVKSWIQSESFEIRCVGGKPLCFLK